MNPTQTIFLSHTIPLAIALQVFCQIYHNKKARHKNDRRKKKVKSIIPHFEGR